METNMSLNDKVVKLAEIVELLSEQLEILTKQANLREKEDIINFKELGSQLNKIKASTPSE